MMDPSPTRVELPVTWSHVVLFLIISSSSKYLDEYAWEVSSQQGEKNFL